MTSIYPVKKKIWNLRVCLIISVRGCVVCAEENGVDKENMRN